MSLSLVDRQKVMVHIEECLQEVYEILSEGLYEPSERGAGEAFSDRSCQYTCERICELIELVSPFQLEEGDLTKPVSFEMVLDGIRQNPKIIEGLDRFIIVDAFMVEPSDRKYSCTDTIYKDTMSNRYIGVWIQRGIGEWADMITDTSVREVNPITRTVVSWE